MLQVELDTSCHSQSLVYEDIDVSTLLVSETVTEQKGDDIYFLLGAFHQKHATSTMEGTRGYHVPIDGSKRVRCAIFLLSPILILVSDHGEIYGKSSFDCSAPDNLRYPFVSYFPVFSFYLYVQNNGT